MIYSYGLQYRAVSIYEGVEIGVVVEGSRERLLEGGFDRLLEGVGIRLLGVSGFGGSILLGGFCWGVLGVGGRDAYREILVRAFCGIHKSQN